MKRKQNNEKSLKEVLNELVSTYRLENRMDGARVVNLWKEIMGNAIANRTRRIYVRQGVLYLTIDSAPLKQELFMEKLKVMAMLNEKLGKEYIKEIVLR